MWHVVGDDFSRFMLDFFDFGTIPPEINTTWVALIPKGEGAIEMKDFRLISMVGCLYKVIAKLLSRCLKHVMEDIVGETQFAFVSDRQIIDGVLLVNEVVY